MNIKIGKFDTLISELFSSISSFCVSITPKTRIYTYIEIPYRHNYFDLRNLFFSGLLCVSIVMSESLSVLVSLYISTTIFSNSALKRFETSPSREKKNIAEKIRDRKET